MGAVAQARGDSAAAREAFNRADVQYKTGLQAHPDLPEGHIGVGDLLLREGRQKEALGSYLRAATARPDEPAVYYRLGTLLEKENPRLAVRHARRRSAAPSDGVQDRANRSTRDRDRRRVADDARHDRREGSATPRTWCSFRM